MTARIRFAALLATLATGTAVAHTKLASSVPAAEAVLERAPTEIVLEFREPVQLTAVTLTNGAPVERALDALPTERASRFTIGVRAQLAAGRYVLAWRAVGADTHLVSGDIPFTIAAHED
jgi:methionine-rich copper-binding protein CopC